MSLYEVLKASKTNRFPDYWTLLWGRKMSASMIKTITGVLPLTFTAKGGTAVDWVIEGNDDNGTENLWNENYENISVHATYKPIYVGNGSFTLSTNAPLSDGAALLFLMPGQQSSGGTTARDGVYDGSPRTVTSVDGYVTLIYRIYGNEDPRDYQTMLTKGSTAPDHYIPYQQGVGERTENIVAPIRTANGWKQGYRNYRNGDYVPSYTNGEWLYDVYIPINSASFTFWATNVSNPSSSFYFFDSDKQYLPNTDKGTNNYNNVIISNISPDAAYMQFAFRTYCMSEQEIIDNNYQVMLVQGSTVPTSYIPYGYQIPLTVSQDGQTDKTVDIYIGDSPLTESETVSKTSTGVDIELFNGENTVSTTLYNKPAMEIKYK